MRKVFTLLLAVLLVAACPLYAYAEDVTDPAAETEAVVDEVTEETTEATTEETVEETTEETTEDETVVEATEAPTEAEETTVEEVTTEDATEAETEQDELAALLDVATPDDIERIKQYILYGTAVLPLSEKTVMFILENINPISWIVVGVIMLVAVLVYLSGNKKNYNDNKILNENAIEAFAKSVQDSENARKLIEAASVAITKRLDDAEKAAQSRDNAMLARMDEDMAEILGNAAKTVAEATAAMQEAARRETAVQEALVLVSKATKFLTDHAKSIPEWDRDQLTAIFNEAEAKIEEVTRHDETDEK
jgi:hypothetical protein